jgi:hypothetical protein
MSHRGGVSDGTSGGSTKRVSTVGAEDKLAQRWAQFQLGISMPVSLACSRCALALAEDADVDGKAIAAYCMNKPKLKKQLDDFLASTDFIMLIGALGGTAQKMVSHHSIAKKLPFGMAGTPAEQQQEAEQHQGHNPTEQMMQYMSGLPDEQRHKLMDSAIDHARKIAEQGAATARAQEAARQMAQPIAVGEEPVPDVELTDRDKQIAAAMHAGSEFADAAL